MFIAKEVAIELVGSIREVVQTIERFDPQLGDQLRRAAQRGAEPRRGSAIIEGNKAKHYAIAHGSANEVKAALDLTRAWGWIDEAQKPREILDRLLWRLTHPRVG